MRVFSCILSKRLVTSVPGRDWNRLGCRCHGSNTQSLINRFEWGNEEEKISSVIRLVYPILSSKISGRKNHMIFDI